MNIKCRCPCPPGVRLTCVLWSPQSPDVFLAGKCLGDSGPPWSEHRPMCSGRSEEPGPGTGAVTSVRPHPGARPVCAQCQWSDPGARTSHGARVTRRTRAQAHTHCLETHLSGSADGQPGQRSGWSASGDLTWDDMT